MSSIIVIKNRLEVKSGSVVQIPGCEPVSSLTSLGLLKNFHCDNAVLPVKVVLNLIPGSKLVKVMTPEGHISTGWFVELPSGPPRDGNKCPADCLPDWYAMLRAYNPSIPKEEPDCSAFSINPCQSELDDIRTPRDPNMKPLETPFIDDNPNHINPIKMIPA